MPAHEPGTARNSYPHRLPIHELLPYPVRAKTAHLPPWRSNYHPRADDPSADASSSYARSPCGLESGCSLRTGIDVLFVLTDLSVGGAENQVKEMALRFRLKGFSVAVASLIPADAYVDELSRAGINVVDLGMKRGHPNPRGILRLRRVIQRFQPAVVHSHMVHANLIVRVTRIVSRIPVLVCTAHAHAEGNWLTDIAYGITDGLADRTTHVSRVGLERYLKVRAISRKRALWIPNGIDIERFGGSSERRTSIRKALGVEEGEFLWLAVAAFRPEKAHDHLVRAFARLPKAAHLVVVGEGPLRPSVMRLASDMSVGDRIAYLGGRDDVAAIMSAADAFVLCSRWEALPLVLLEAAASRLPIVTTDVGGCSEIVEHHLNGYLTPPGRSAIPCRGDAAADDAP